MKHLCTPGTDLDELVGHDESDGYHYGPLSQAMRSGDLLELQASDQLSPVTRCKLEACSHGVLVVETGEMIAPDPHFQLILQ